MPPSCCHVPSPTSVLLMTTPAFLPCFPLPNEWEARTHKPFLLITPAAGPAPSGPARAHLQSGHLPPRGSRANAHAHEPQADGLSVSEGQLRHLWPPSLCLCLGQHLQGIWGGGRGGGKRLALKVAVLKVRLWAEPNFLCASFIVCTALISTLRPLPCGLQPPLLHAGQLRLCTAASCTAASCTARGPGARRGGGEESRSSGHQANDRCTQNVCSWARLPVQLLCNYWVAICT